MVNLKIKNATVAVLLFSVRFLYKCTRTENDNIKIINYYIPMAFALLENILGVLTYNYPHYAGCFGKMPSLVTRKNLLVLATEVYGDDGTLMEILYRKRLTVV